MTLTQAPATASSTSWSRAWEMLARARLRLTYLAVGGLRSVRWLAWETLARRRPTAPVERPRDDPPQAFARTIDGRCVVEPQYGWVIAEPSTLVTDSLTFGWGTHTWRGREWVGLPKVIDYLRRDVTVEHRRAVSICSPWPENYYHFVMDVLPKITQLLDADLIQDDPVLVATQLQSQRFFQEAAGMGALAGIDFVPLGGAYHGANRLSYAYGGPYGQIDFARIRELLAVDDGFPLSAQLPDRRIFITRHANRGRVPSNIADIDRVFMSHGFEIVDLDEYGFGEQIELFRHSSHIAAIHGAALANLVWSSPQRTIAMELVPRTTDTSFDCFVHLAATLGLKFSRVVGVNDGYAHKRASFEVSMSDLENAIEGFTSPVRHEGGPKRR